MATVTLKFLETMKASVTNETNQNFSIFLLDFILTGYEKLG